MFHQNISLVFSWCRIDFMDMKTKQCELGKPTQKFYRSLTQRSCNGQESTFGMKKDKQSTAGPSNITTQKHFHFASNYLKYSQVCFWGMSHNIIL